MKTLLISISLLLMSSMSHAQTEKFSFLVLNIQKMENASWSLDKFKEISQDSDLVLIQESVNQFPIIRENQYQEFYKSWGNADYDTGLSTISKSPALTSVKLVSPTTEPIANTPKISSVETFDLVTKENNLLVINTHGINFTSTRNFKLQIDAIYAEVRNHIGPMIWAGDFNTWSTGRKDYLDSVTKDLSLEEVNFGDRTELFLELDHAYVRGAKVTSASQLPVDLSDHRPLKVEMEIFSDEPVQAP